VQDEARTESEAESVVPPAAETQLTAESDVPPVTPAAGQRRKRRQRREGAKA